jgi:uncharacterized membrane protein YfhO
MDGRGFLVLSEIYYPDWVAYVDGVRTKILKANYALRAVQLDGGAHHVVLVYESEDFRTGLLISGIFLLGGLGVAVAKGFGVVG